MGDVRVGDSLFDENGNQCKVTFATDVQYGRTCYDVVFSDGTIITADADHQWATETKQSRKRLGRAAKPAALQHKTATTQRIKDTLIHTSGERNHSVRVAKPLKIREKSLPVHPYVMGLWLGDGASKCGEIHTGMQDVEEIRKHVQSFGYACLPSRKNPRSNGVCFTVKGLITQLREAGLLGNKHIPAAYLRGSIEQRKHLLYGLMDSDGYVDPKGSVEFCNTQKHLAESFYELIVSLGIKGTINEGRAMLNGVDHGTKYRVNFTPRGRVALLKRRAIEDTKSQKQRGLRRYIVDVRERESVPVRCIQVDSPNSLFLCSKSMIPTHNTRTGSEWVRNIAENNPGYRIALVGRTAADVRDVMITGESGILNVCPPWNRPLYEPSKRLLTWANGAIATAYSAEKPDALRGPQHNAAWCDELAAWRYTDAWTQLNFGLRLGQKPRTVVTTTPLPTDLIRSLASHKRTILSTGSMQENSDNLAPEFIEHIKNEYEGTRLGDQEIHGLILDDIEGALWKMDSIRRISDDAVPDFKRVVVAIDPAVTNTKNSDETGIVVVAEGIDKKFYILGDYSIRASADTWAQRAIAAYDTHECDQIVGEVNNGGDLVEIVIRQHRQNINFRSVRASRGKVARAEPVAALYEQGKVFHVGHFKLLESQMTEYVPGVSRKSPDRMDALVWALSCLALETSQTVEAFSLSIGKKEPWRYG
jgi:predicted phage terminase large subunit-like protein